MLRTVQPMCLDRLKTEHAQQFLGLLTYQTFISNTSLLEVRKRCVHMNTVAVYNADKIRLLTIGRVWTCMVQEVLTKRISIFGFLTTVLFLSVPCSLVFT